MRVFSTSLLFLTLIAGSAFAESAFRTSLQADTLLGRYCLDCHDDEVEKGDVRLDNLGELKLADRLDLLNRVQEQLYIGEMPPKKKKQPSDTDHEELMAWLTGELRKHSSAKLDETMRRYEYGNYVDHDKLFSGEYADLPGYTNDRHWLVSEFIFNEKVNRILDHKASLTIDGKRESVQGSAIRHNKISNPFQLPTNSGVRYYANTSLNGGHLLTMLANAQEAAEHLVYQSRRNRNYLPTVSAIMAMERTHEEVLKRRDAFLRKHIDRVLSDLYGDEHAGLLPTFVSLGVDAESTKPKEGMKKAPYHAAQPGKEYTERLYATMLKCEAKGDSDAELIAKCERVWFNYGLDERQVRTFVTFFHGYLDEFRKQAVAHKYDKRYAKSGYKPLADAEMQIIHETIRTHRAKGDSFLAIIDKSMADWEQGFKSEREAAGPPEEALLRQLVVELFEKVHERTPDAAEVEKYLALAEGYLAELGKLSGIKKLMQTVMLSTEFVYRAEFGAGDADAHDRRLLSPRDASYALAYALTDASPDEELAKAVADGQLNSRADYQREVERMLKKRDQFAIVQYIPIGRRSLTSITNLPARKLRFFREFFGYPQMLPIFKDRKRFGGNYDNVKGRLVVEADRLIEHVLKQDQAVFETLLTMEDFYVFHNGDNESMEAASARVRRVYDYFKDMGWEDFDAEALAEHTDFLAEVNLRGIDVKRLEKDRRYDPLGNFKKIMTSFSMRLASGQADAAPYVSFPAHGPGNGSTRTGKSMDGPEVAKFFNVDMSDWNYSPQQPAKMANRKGMLTHPAWLITHAQNTETDPVKRGKWVLEKLLAGTVPDVPITVDAVIPEDHHRTLRQRLVGATEKDACWKCHERMNPLGYAFEKYDDFGRFRLEESLEHPDNLIEKGPDKAEAHVDLRDSYKTLPVNAKGYLKGTGDPNLDGEVADAIDMTVRLAKSARVRQSIIRHAFRYFLGRNEQLSDSKTLIDADKAYVASGGSFDAVILSLLTSDSFIYRKPVAESKALAAN
ncbi:MAG: hypothetical protein ACI8W8_002984 [Rhodothermales bacterium]|jgi:hypothetical protein